MKRIRVLLAVAALVVGGLSALSGPAWATESEGGGGNQPEVSEASEECIKILEEGKEPDDCQKAPNPILPATNELIWGAIAFTLLFIGLAKFAYPQIKAGMDARAERIRNSLDEADKAKSDAQQVLEEYRSQLADARNEAARIIEEARQAADAMRRDLMSKAEAEAQATRERAQADIEAAIERARAELTARMADLSVTAAELVLQRELTNRDAQIQLVEDYINQVAAQRG